MVMVAEPDPHGLSLESRVFCIQNHDQIGNRAFGDRLSSQISYASWCAASALLLLAPEVPMLFMGQEWAASQPFLYFTDHNQELGRLVTEGRRKEFAHFLAFADTANHESIPDPQKAETFLQSKLDWTELQNVQHANCHRWYQELLRIRKQLLETAVFLSARALNEQAIELSWQSSRQSFRAVVALEGPTVASEQTWQGAEMIFSSEENRTIQDPRPIGWKSEAGTLSFERAGVALLASDNLAGLGKNEHNDG